MDLLDKRILTNLTRNCRMSYQELGSKIGFTANAAKKRVEKLIEGGTLYSFTIKQGDDLKTEVLKKLGRLPESIP